jgi:aminopeptidase YwaD
MPTTVQAAPLPSPAPLPAFAASITRDTLVRQVEAIAGPRVTGSQAYMAAAELVAATARSYGWDARIEPVHNVHPRAGVDPARTGAATLYNVVADKRGTAPDAERKLVLVGAHLDAVPGSPGANDDASGVAAELEVARVLGPVPTRNDVRLLWFDAEELSALGSQSYAIEHMDELQARAKVLLNSDMLASPEPAPGAEGGPQTDATAQMRDLAASAARAGTDFVQRTTTGYRSDHIGFDQLGMPTLTLGADSATADGDPHYHSPQDTVANLSPETFERYGRTLAVAVHDFAQAP